MGRKSREKSQSGAAAPATPPARRVWPGLAVAAVILIVAAVVYVRTDRSAARPPANAPETAPAPQVLAEPINAKFGPHKQDTLPALPFTGYPPPRPTEVVRMAYNFAAEHPEVLGYVPCYCGCNRQGHRGNDDCFVARRAPNGDVEEWDSHGMT